VVETSPKRYRFTAKERDSETALYYHGARYYASWLGRWTAPDPKGLAGSANLFAYCSDNPIILCDPNGMDDIPAPTAAEEDAQACLVDPSTPEPTAAEEEAQQSLPSEHPEASSDSSSQAGGQTGDNNSGVNVPRLASNGTSIAELGLRAGFTPMGPNGPLSGPFLLWSGSPARDAADAAAAGGEGYTIGQTLYGSRASAQELAARTEGLPPGAFRADLDPAVERAIWDKWSGLASRDAAISGQGTASMNEPGTVGPTTTQAMVELPTFGKYAAGMGALGMLSGGLMIWSNDTSDPTAIQALTYTSGGAQLLGGGMQVTGGLLTWSGVEGAAGLVTAGAAATEAGIVLSFPLMAWGMAKGGSAALEQTIVEGSRQDAARSLAQNPGAPPEMYDQANSLDNPINQYLGDPIDLFAPH
jgi:RHS repeat-associated protein